MNNLTFPPSLILLLLFLATLTTHTYSSSLRQLLFFPTFPCYNIRRQTFLFILRSYTLFFPTLLFYSYLTRPSTSSLYLFFHSPLSGTTLKALPWIAATNNLWCLHLHPNRVAWLGVPWNFTSLWCRSPLTLPQPLMICPTPYQPRSHILITPHSLPLPHTILITFEVDGMVNNVFLHS